MDSNTMTIILSAAVVALVVFLYFYNKKNSNHKNDLVNQITNAVISILTDYIKEKGVKEAKDFDELSDYVIFIKNFLFDKIKEQIEASEIPDKFKKYFTDTEVIDSIVDSIIVENMELLEKTFEDSRKKPKTRKKKTESLPETSE